jgi:hypothetical protein
MQGLLCRRAIAQFEYLFVLPSWKGAVTSHANFPCDSPFLTMLNTSLQ